MFFQTDKEAIEYCKKYEHAERLADSFCYRDNKGKGWICKCGSGTGKNGTGISLNMSKDGVGLFHCHACNWGGDIFSLYQHEKDCNFITAKKEIFKEMNIMTEQTQARNHNQTNRKDNDDELKKVERNARYLEELASSDYDLENNTDVIAYLSKRNISIETAKRFNLRQHFKAFKGMKQAEDLIIIPTTDVSFLYRSVSSAIKRKSAGKSYIFNPEACTSEKGVFVCEGAFDALSFEECNFNALALNGVAKTDFIRLAKLNEDTTFFICTDRDKRGTDACYELIDELSKLKIKVFNAQSIIADSCKDINDTLCNAGRDAFIQRVNEYLQDPFAAQLAEHEKSFSQTKTADDYEKEIDADEEQAIPTTFTELDRKLDGGLHSGFYVFGAGTAMGKTAFVLQLADSIAKQDIDVLYFSLEMSKKELTARSLSRESYCVDSQNALSTRQVLKKRTQNEEEKTALKEALARYKQYSKHIFVIESIANTKTEDIRKTIERHRLITNNRKCIVVVDYAQILASADNRLTDKQAIDKNVVELKRICKDFNICVIGLSSFNRESYNQVVNLSSFKESGAIEYTCDCLIAMQYAGFDYKENESDNTTRQKRIRELKERNTERKARGDAIEMQLKILKNRNGVTCDDIRLMFKSRYNYFYEKLF